jgi:hypothetical protein
MGKAMLMTMQQQTTTLASMHAQMTTLSATVSGLKDHERKEPREGAMGSHGNLRAKTSTPGTGATEPFYAVAQGAGGHQGIYLHWSGTSPWVSGVPENVHQKFHSQEEAQRFIENCNIERARRNQAQGCGNLFRQSPVNNMEQGPPGGGGLDTRSNAFLYGAAEGLQRPSTDFLGPDPSTKTEDEESDLLNLFVPKAVDIGMKKGISNAITDVIGLPGGYQSNIMEDNSGLALFTQSMAEMDHGNRSDQEMFGRPDISWRSIGRISLKSITDEDKLRKRIKTLIKLRHRVRKQTTRLMINGLKKVGWLDESITKSWAQWGPLYRIMSDSLDYNMSLLQHLMGLSTAGVPWWSYVQSEIEYHVVRCALFDQFQTPGFRRWCSCIATCGMDMRIACSPPLSKLLET